MMDKNGTSSLCLSLVSNQAGRKSTTLIGCLMMLIFVCNIVANTLLAFALFKSKQLRTLSNKYIFVMIVVDMCLGISVILEAGVFSIAGSKRSCSHIKAVQFYGLFLEFFSCSMILCISTDRYLHVAKPFRYHAVKYVLQMNISLIAWLSCGLVVCAIYLIWPSFYLHLVYVLFIIFIMLAFLVINTKTLSILKRHQNNTVAHLQNESPLAESLNSIRSERLTAVKTIRLVLAAVFICYFPFNITSTILTYYNLKRKSDPGDTFKLLYSLSSAVMFSASFVNSLIIIHGNRKCRRIISSILRNTIQPQE